MMSKRIGIACDYASRGKMKQVFHIRAVGGIMSRMTKPKPDKKKGEGAVKPDVPSSAKEDGNTKRALVGTAAALATLLARERLKMIPDYIALPLAAALGWFALVQSGWFKCLARKYIHYPTYGIIVVTVFLLALFMPQKKPDALPVVTATAPNSPGSIPIAIGNNSGDLKIYPPANPSPESMLSGVLMPANEPDPVDFETELPPSARKGLAGPDGRIVPSNALKVFLGTCLAWNGKEGVHKILEIGGEDIITLKCTPNGLYVCANLWRADGRRAATITDNKLEINANNYFRPPERPDRSEIRVFDNTGTMVLRARYINESAIVFQGVFYGKNGKKVTVTADSVTDGLRTYHKSIAGENRRCAWSFWRPEPSK
jgi:hypothetical protein